MQNSNPLVSVIVPSYNHEKYVADALNSVLNQTYSNIELIVIDDGSKDNSPAIIKKIANENPGRIICHNRRVNMGLCPTWNEMLTFVHGDFFFPLASDDMLPSTAIEKRVAFMQAHPNVDVCATDFDVIGSADNTIVSGPDKLKITPQFTRFFNADFSNMYFELLFGNFIPASTVFVRMSKFTKDDLWNDPACPNLHDYDLWLRLAYKHTWAYLPESTWIYRWHGANLSYPNNPMNALPKVVSQMVYVLSKQVLVDQTPEQRKITLAMIIKQGTGLYKHHMDLMTRQQAA